MPAAISVHKNVDTVRRGYQAFNAGDLKTLAELFHENAAWHVPGHGPMAGDYRGRDAVFSYFARLGQETGGTLKCDLKHLLSDEEGRVAGIHRETAQRNGKTIDTTYCIIFEFKDGRVISGTEYIFDLHAMEAFWG